MAFHFLILNERALTDKPFALDIDKEHLPDIDTLKERIAFHEECLKKLEESKKSTLLFTDPEAAMMPAKEGGIKACYNVQTIVDTTGHMIVDFQVTDCASDRGLLCQAIEECKQDLQIDVIHAIADKGYESSKDIEKCLLNGTIPDVGFIQDRDERLFALEYEEKEITSATKASTQTADIQACLHAGVLPDCYKDTNISIQVQEESVVSCFIRHEDGTVTCPMGRTLFPLGKKKYGEDFGSREACRTCPNRCTDSKKPKRVRIGYNSTYVPVIMYGDPQFPLQKIPDVEQHSPYNHFGLRKRPAKKVVISIKRDIAKQKQRQQTSEHPFGTIKHYDGAYYFLCKGHNNTTAEFALTSMAYDMRRAINICEGVENFILRFEALLHQGTNLQFCKN